MAFIDLLNKGIESLDEEINKLMITHVKNDKHLNLLYRDIRELEERQEQLEFQIKELEKEKQGLKNYDGN